MSGAPSQRQLFEAELGMQRVEDLRAVAKAKGSLAEAAAATASAAADAAGQVTSKLGVLNGSATTYAQSAGIAFSGSMSDAVHQAAREARKIHRWL